ncbi:MAG: hypothetical protein JST30_03425 [Armatimonadetes bacterium]|nr:hypothetical protein [Armatimonadota bacterium]
MSHSCTPTEFQRQFEHHLAAFSLADSWQRGDALRKILASLSRMGYFSITRSEVTTKNHPMLEVRGQFSLAKRLPDLVQVDLSNIWADSTSDACRSVHAFAKTAEGFDMLLLAVFGATVVTCCLHVVGTH